MSSSARVTTASVAAPTGPSPATTTSGDKRLLVVLADTREVGQVAGARQLVQALGVAAPRTHSGRRPDVHLDEVAGGRDQRAHGVAGRPGMVTRTPPV